jgi:hypothetical protein
VRGNRTPHQDFLGMQSEIVNVMWMRSVPQTHVLSVDVPRKVKVGLITKPNVLQGVRILLQGITEFLRKTCRLFSAHSCQRLDDMDLVRMHA